MDSQPQLDGLTITSQDDQEVWWVPLESNPDVMTEYSRLLGAAKGTWLDVYGFDEDALSCIPQPVVAVIFLYATTPEFDMTVKTENDQLRAADAATTIDPNVYFMEQTIRNACGGIAVIHALANNTRELSVTEGPLRTLIDQSIGLTPHERGKALECAQEIENLHHTMATSGQTAVPAHHERVGNHFVTFVHRGGRLVELSGGRPCPIDHGPTTPEKLLNDAVRVCQKRMENILGTVVSDPEETRHAGGGGRGGTDGGGEYRFAVFALTAAFSD